jgi:probable rRNA maturation factor
MTIQFVNETEASFDFDLEGIAKDVINASLDEEEFPFEVEVGLTLVDNETIHELNREHRGIDRPTDVLSFPLIDYPSAGDFSKIEDSDDNFSPESGEVMLGDIVISIPKVIEQAEEFNHSIKREYSFLIAHSMLHLMGYDHMEDDERVIMENKQSLILDNLGITRSKED